MNEPEAAAEVVAVRRNANRGCTFRDDEWTDEMMEHLGMESKMRPQGWPRKAGALLEVL